MEALGQLVCCFWDRVPLHNPGLPWTPNPSLSLQGTRWQACIIMICRDDGFPDTFREKKTKQNIFFSFSVTDNRLEQPTKARKWVTQWRKTGWWTNQKKGIYTQQQHPADRKTPRQSWFWSPFCLWYSGVVLRVSHVLSGCLPLSYTPASCSSTLKKGTWMHYSVLQGSRLGWKKYHMTCNNIAWWS